MKLGVPRCSVRPYGQGVSCELVGCFSDLDVIRVHMMRSCVMLYRSAGAHLFDNCVMRGFVGVRAVTGMFYDRKICHNRAINTTLCTVPATKENVTLPIHVIL